MKAALGSVVVAAAVLVAGPASTRAAGPQATTAGKPSDSTLDSRIEKRIHDSSLKKYDISALVNDGVVTLTGTVPSEADRRKAAQLATVPGVARVDNQIVVDLDTARTTRGTTGKVEKGAEKTKEGVDKAIDTSAEGIAKTTEKTKEGAAKAADKSAQGLAKAGEAITDVWIKGRVKSKFLDEDVLKGSDIDIDVGDHVVTLSGTVPSEAARARAIEETKKVDGVHQVIDKLTIGPRK